MLASLCIALLNLGTPSPSLSAHLNSPTNYFPPPQELYTNGFSSQDIITILFRVVRNHSELDNEFLKLEYIKQIGFCHMRIAEGVASRLQISGLLAELCSLTGKSKGR